MAAQKSIRLVDDSASSQQVRAGRSPSYPAFSLVTAVSKLKVLYKAQRNNAVSVGAALETLGYKGESGGTAGRNIAALIAFGVLSEEGAGPHRKVRITELGRKIVLLEEDDPELLTALREAAVSPRIYREMLDTWPESLPTDTEMKKYLTFNKGYNEETVRVLIRDFRATYDFAKLDENGTMSETKLDEIARKNDEDTAPVANSAREVVVTPSSPSQPPTGPMGPTPTPPANSLPHLVHLPGGRTVYFYIPHPFSERDFKRLKDYLDLFEDVIVSGEPPKAIQTGPAIWKNHEVDQPVTVVGELGDKNGRRYVRIEGSSTGIPLDEVEYEDGTLDGR